MTSAICLVDTARSDLGISSPIIHLELAVVYSHFSSKKNEFCLILPCLRRQSSSVFSAWLFSLIRTATSRPQSYESCFSDPLSYKVRVTLENIALALPGFIEQCDHRWFMSREISGDMRTILLALITLGC